MSCAIWVHFTDASSAVVKEMLTLKVPNNHPLRGMTNFINSHTLPIMKVFVALVC